MLTYPSHGECSVVYELADLTTFGRQAGLRGRRERRVRLREGYVGNEWMRIGVQKPKVKSTMSSGKKPWTLSCGGSDTYTGLQTSQRTDEAAAVAAGTSSTLIPITASLLFTSSKNPLNGATGVFSCCFPSSLLSKGLPPSRGMVVAGLRL